MTTFAPSIRMIGALICCKIPKVSVLAPTILASILALFGALVKFVWPLAPPRRMVRAFVCSQISDVVVLAPAVLAIKFWHDYYVISC